MRQAAIFGALVSILLLTGTIYLGWRLNNGDASVKTIHLAFAISGALLSILSHVVSLLVILWKTKAAS